LILVLAACIPLGRWYAASTAHNVINQWNKLRFQDFYALPPGSLDMVFLGSSHSYCTFDPARIDDALGVSSFQLGMPLQLPDTTYYTLREVYKTQHPRTVVVELYWELLATGYDAEQADTLFSFLHDPALEADFRENAVPLADKVIHLIPPIRYQDDFLAYQNSQLLDSFARHFGLVAAAEKQQGTEQYKDKGYAYCDYHMLPGKYGKDNQFIGVDGGNFQFSDNQKKYLEKIVELCREQGSRLIFVTAPIAPVSMSLITNYDAIHQAVSAFAARQNVPYLDFNLVNQQLNLLTNDNFRDDAHLNDSGVAIADEYFAGWMKGMGIDTNLRLNP